MASPEKEVGDLLRQKGLTLGVESIDGSTIFTEAESRISETPLRQL